MFLSAASNLISRFTGKERDAETGLDFFGARYMSAPQGRWSSPDLVNVTDDRLVSPTNTLNKYIYGGNNPLKYLDPDGRDITVFYETGFPTGHMMVAAYNQATSDFAFLSVGPQTRHDPNIIWNPNKGVPGTSEFNLPSTLDDLRQNFAALTIRTTPEVAQQAINAIRNGAGTGNYAIRGNNCTSSCAKLLKDIGLSPGSKGLLPWTPAKLWSNLTSKYGREKTPWYQALWKDSTSLIQRSTTPGIDYGDPDYNNYSLYTFDFIFLLLQATGVETSVTTTCTITGPNGEIVPCE